jgi:hypothetical protein
MKPGDLIKHKRCDVLGLILRFLEGKKLGRVTVFFSNSTKPSTASLKILKDNWEIISDR